ncbi:UNVERIFIED_CONTAM: hypothetical protein PYX00_002596 [Menopon gallinae]|uniref:Uncharacterized protein n=1 Tax=Menopon gallinae TaxID=328185 RepID=A0AAW2IHX2_9NEOP
MTRFRLFAKCQSLAVNNSRLFRRSRPLTDGKPVVSPFRLNSPSPRICLMPERPRSGQEIYFETVMANNPDYPEHHLICENTMKKRFTANKLVMAVRDLRSNDMGVTTVPQKFDFACKDYLEDSFSADDVIEILCKLRKGLLVLPSHLQQLKDVLILQIEHLMKKDDVPVNKLLTVLHLLKNLTQLSSVCDPLVQFFYENKSKLTGSQLTVYFHALHIYKNFPLHRCTEEFDSFLSHHLKSMSLENVAVIAFAFFRCLSKPGNMSCKVVAEKLRYHLENCEHIRYETLTSVCKFLQFAGSHALANDLYAISEVFIGKMEKYSLMTAIHVASANINVNNVNARLVELILEKTEINPDKLRLKDYERLFLSALFANIDLRKKKEFIEVVKKELEMRENDFMKYHISFISLLMHLISYGIYIDHLLSFALSQDYRSLTTTDCDCKSRISD